LRAALDSIGRDGGLMWKRARGVYLARDCRWYREEEIRVPSAWLKRWEEARDRKSLLLPPATLLEIARLEPPRQRYAGRLIPEAGAITRVLPYALLIESLDRNLKARVLQGEPVSLNALPERALAILMDRRLGGAEVRRRAGAAGL